MNSWSDNQEMWGAINAWNKKGSNDDEDFSVMSFRAIYNENGLETKKLLTKDWGGRLL